MFFISSLGAGGAERTVVNLSAFLAHRGHDVSVVTLLPATADFYTLDTGIRRLSLNRQPSNRGLRKITGVWSFITDLRAMIRVNQPDVVVGMMVHSAVAAIIAVRGLPCKVIAAERNNPRLQNIFWLWNILRKLSYNRADAVVAQTQHIQTCLESDVIGLKKSGKVTVIPNAVEWPMRNYPPWNDFDAIADPDRKTILAAGRLHHQKGFDLLIDAFAKLAGHHPDWDMVIIGAAPEPAYRLFLGSKIKKLNLPSRIKLPGRVGNISEWFQRADVFVLSSRYEGFPNTLLEAMAAGRACVSFDCKSGPNEIIRDGIDGLLTPAEDIAGLAEKLELLMNDEALRVKLSARAIETRERFAPSGIYKKWETLFKTRIFRRTAQDGWGKEF